MVKLKKILFISLFAGFSFSAAAEGLESPANNSVTEQQDKTMSLDILINGASKVQLENVPTVGYLEVYSLLGVKVTSVNLKACVDGTCPLTLSKGLYIIKAGKVAQKVIVR